LFAYRVVYYNLKYFAIQPYYHDQGDSKLVNHKQRNARVGVKL